VIFKVYLMRRGGRRLRSSETINAPACIGEQELTGGQSATAAVGAEKKLGQQCAGHLSFSR
jgi:hypothetical protein